MKVLLVTGGAGFIGTNFIKYFLSRNKNFLIVNIDKLLNKSNIDYLKELENSPRYHFIKGDICNYELVNYVLKKYKPDFIINFADETVKESESELERFTERPTLYAQTNIMGTLTLLEGVKYIWKRRYLRGNRFVQVSTDEVYGFTDEKSKANSDYKLEDSGLIPANTYSASKAAADLMVGTFSKAYEIPAIIARCCTNYGPYQSSDKFIPRCISNTAENKPIQLSKEDFDKKEWIHVQDNCIALIRTLFYGRPGEIYNLGTGEEASNYDIAAKILKFQNKPEDSMLRFQETPGNIRSNSLNSYKAKCQLNWSNKIKLDDGLNDTLNWYKSRITL